MPLKKDETGNRRVEMEFIAPGTPEQVWQAMATGPGTTAWFTKATIDGRIGGEVQFDYGAHGKQKGEVTAWEPPHRFAYVERDWSQGAPPVATEITITARSGDTCVVRMVHSLFSSSDDWDDQMEGFEKGWPAFFEVLRLYLTHFAGQQAASFIAMTTAEGGDLGVWKRLAERLDLVGVNVGEPRSTPSQPEMLSGVIERIYQDRQQRYVMMRLDTPGPGIALVGTYASGAQVNASMSIFYYGDGAERRATQSQERWRAWLVDRFSADAAATA